MPIRSGRKPAYRPREQADVPEFGLHRERRSGLETRPHVLRPVGIGAQGDVLPSQFPKTADKGQIGRGQSNACRRPEVLISNAIPRSAIRRNIVSITSCQRRVSAGRLFSGIYRIG